MPSSQLGSPVATCGTASTRPIISTPITTYGVTAAKISRVGISFGATLRTVLAAAHRLFAALSAPSTTWRVELHQFRIEAGAGTAGKPTPEGVHRDGVDWVLVLMVRRTNIAAGTTTIHDLARREIGAFTLVDPFDAALVDDRRCFHGVTPVVPLDAARPAHRDVLVATFRALPV